MLAAMHSQTPFPIKGHPAIHIITLCSRCKCRRPHPVIQATHPSTAQHSTAHRPSSPLLLRHDDARPGRRLGRDAPVGDPDINEGLHGLHVALGQQAEELGDGDEVDEAAVEVGPAAGGRVLVLDVVEGVQPVGVVDVRVQPEHLPEDGLAVVEEGLREASGLAHPVVAGGEGAEGWGEGHGVVGPAGRVVILGDDEVVGGEDVRVGELAADPALHHADVVRGGDFDGVLVAVEPGVGVGAGRC